MCLIFLQCGPGFVIVMIIMKVLWCVHCNEHNTLHNNCVHGKLILHKIKKRKGGGRGKDTRDGLNTSMYVN